MKTISFSLSVVIIFLTCVVNGQDKTTNGNSWTKTKIEISNSNLNESGENVLQKVRIGKHKNYDRVVFEFAGESVPKSKVGFAKPPFKLGESDKTVRIKGKSFLEIVLTPAYAHDIESGKVTVKDRENAVSLNSIVEIRRIYDFEGQVIYVLGLKSQKQFRVQTLSNPARLVVDVKH